MSKNGLWKLVGVGLLVWAAFVGLVVVYAWVVTEEPFVRSPSTSLWQTAREDTWFEDSLEAERRQAERGATMNKRFAEALDVVTAILAVALATIPAALALGLAWQVFRWASGAS